MSAAPTTSTSPEEIAVGEGPARQVEDALAETAALLGYEILLVEWAGTGRGRILRIYLDHPDGVTLDDCTRMGRVLSDALDAAEADPAQPALAALLGQPYNLEVSSPGIDRPIQKLSDFARFVGYTARLRMDATSTRRRYRGELKGVEGDQILIEVDGQLHTLSFEGVLKAQLVLSLDEYQALGAAAPSSPSADGGVE